MNKPSDNAIKLRALAIGAPAPDAALLEEAADQLDHLEKLEVITFVSIENVSRAVADRLQPVLDCIWIPDKEDTDA